MNVWKNWTVSKTNLKTTLTCPHCTKTWPVALGSSQSNKSYYARAHLISNPSCQAAQNAQHPSNSPAESASAVIRREQTTRCQTLAAKNSELATAKEELTAERTANVDLRRQVSELVEERTFERERFEMELARFATTVGGMLEPISSASSMALSTLNELEKASLHLFDNPPSLLVPTPRTAKIITLPSVRGLYQTLMRNDALHSQMTRPKWAAMQLIDYFCSQVQVDLDQLEFFKKAYATMPAKKALHLVGVHHAVVDCIINEIAEHLHVVEQELPELASPAKVAAELEAISLLHLHAACRRNDIRPPNRVQFGALYLGQYREVQQRFAGYVSVTTAEMINFLRDEMAGKVFWRNLCVAAGLPSLPYNSTVYEIEHVLNKAWGGPNHFLNYMILFGALNRSAEFLFGPGEVKLAALGRLRYTHVQKFCKWHAAQDASMPRDAFCRIQEHYYALPPISLSGKQLTLRECKRPRGGN